MYIGGSSPLRVSGRSGNQQRAIQSLMLRVKSFSTTSAAVFPWGSPGCQILLLFYLLVLHMLY